MIFGRQLLMMDIQCGLSHVYLDIGYFPVIFSTEYDAYYLLGIDHTMSCYIFSVLRIQSVSNWQNMASQ